MGASAPFVAIIRADTVKHVTAARVRELNEFCTQHQHDVLAIAPTAADLQQFAARPHEIRSAITVLPFHASELAADWAEFPPLVAVRIAPPEAAAVVVIALAQLKLNAVPVEPFSDVSDPVWEWLLCQTDRGCEISLGPTLPRSVGVSATRPRLSPLSAAGRRGWLLAHLRSEHLLPAAVSPADAIALRAGLMQMHDFLDASHHVSQSIEGEGRHAAGDYWHAVMHRREPDYHNSKYWFRRVGVHPLFPELAQRAELILRACPSPESEHWRNRLVTKAGWDPLAFVDLCAGCADSEETPLAIAAREIQWQEMRLLLRHTCRDALGS
jgi:hypothetical protein